MIQSTENSTHAHPHHRRDVTPSPIVWSKSPPLTLQFIAGVTKALSQEGKPIYHIRPLALADQHGGLFGDAFNFIKDTAVRLAKPLAQGAINLVTDFSQFPVECMTTGTKFMGLLLKTSVTRLPTLVDKIQYLTNQPQIWQVLIEIPNEQLGLLLTSSYSLKTNDA